MADHDPLCPTVYLPGEGGCRCALIDRIRADERDAARVEVAALRAQYVVEEFIDTDGYPSMRVVKGEHVGQNEWAANIRREVLADLRAKVEGLRDEAKADPVGSAVWRTTAYESVLALIEEAQND